MDLPKAATLGTRLRLLRKRLGVTLDEFSQKTGLSRNAISRAERDAIRQINPRVLQQLLRQLSGRLQEAFPNGDPYDFLIPSNTLGGWMRNQRLRRGMAQKQLAKLLDVHPFTIVRYDEEQHHTRFKRPTAPEGDTRGWVRAIPETRYNIRWSQRPTHVSSRPVRELRPS